MLLEEEEMIMEAPTIIVASTIQQSTIQMDEHPNNHKIDPGAQINEKMESIQGEKKDNVQNNHNHNGNNDVNGLLEDEVLQDAPPITLSILFESLLARIIIPFIIILTFTATLYFTAI